MLWKVAACRSAGRFGHKSPKPRISMEEKSLNFIEEFVDADVKAGKHGGRVQTRFPPEPNGYLHLGHATAICLNFTLARDFNGQCNLRFDDTNPEKESQEYVDAIKEDIAWLGFEWAKECYASDYFEQLYEWACQLIRQGDAFVCDLSGEEMREYRGTFEEPGQNSPYRERSVEENLDLFQRMRAGEYPDGSRTLRAKIDMAHPNLVMRDPVMYRLRRAHHHRVGDAWPIYPSYDFTHGQSDSIEQVTHSLCSLEFAEHRPLYDWFIEKLGIFPSKQYEFARRNLNFTVMSKRKLLELVAENHVVAWDDPRMPTICGARRRGVPPESIRKFCATIGVTKTPGTSEYALLEATIRETLNPVAPRYMAVLDPLLVILDNVGADETLQLSGILNPEDEAAGSRSMPFSRRILISADDFMEDPPKKFFRLAPEKEVRLRYAHCVKCIDVAKDASGNIVALHGEVDPATLNANPEGRKVKGVIHWVSEPHAVQAEVRVYDRLFTAEKPESDKEHRFVEFLNPESLVTKGAVIEPALAEAARSHLAKVAEQGKQQPGERPLYKSDFRVQFERVGYFCLDEDATPEHLIFNRTVALRDSWAKGK